MPKFKSFSKDPKQAKTFKTQSAWIETDSRIYKMQKETLRIAPQMTAEAAELVGYLEDLDPGVQQKPTFSKMQKQIHPYRLGFTAITVINSRSRDGKRVLKFQMMVAGAQTLTFMVGRTMGGWGGSHDTENEPECYKSTKFPPVTQHVSASFVSCNSFFLLLLKRHFFPPTAPPLW